MPAQDWQYFIFIREAYQRDILRLYSDRLFSNIRVMTNGQIGGFRESELIAMPSSSRCHLHSRFQHRLCYRATLRNFGKQDSYSILQQWLRHEPNNKKAQAGQRKGLHHINGFVMLEPCVP